jgi:uncharacterized membrane protein HdeD (DUF308 family)
MLFGYRAYQIIIALASIVFGVLAFIWPGLTLVALIFLWGAYALIDGGIALWAAITGKGGESSQPSTTL